MPLLTADGTVNVSVLSHSLYRLSGWHGPSVVSSVTSQKIINSDLCFRPFCMVCACSCDVDSLWELVPPPSRSYKVSCKVIGDGGLPVALSLTTNSFWVATCCSHISVQPPSTDTAFIFEHNAIFNMYDQETCKSFSLCSFHAPLPPSSCRRCWTCWRRVRQISLWTPSSIQPALWTSSTNVQPSHLAKDAVSPQTQNIYLFRPSIRNQFHCL